LTPLIVLLGLCLPLVTLSYLTVCSASPWGRCAACRGTGGRHHCHRCHGTGLRPRLGWQALTYLRRIHRDGTR
jgi:hypothetical protein